MKQIFKRLAGETVIYGMSSMVARAVSAVLLIPLHTYVFPPETYADVSVLYSWFAFAMVVLSMRLETAYFRIGADALQRKTAFSSALAGVGLVSSIFLIGIFFFYEDVVELLRLKDSYGWLIILAGIILFFDALSEIPFARLRLEQKAKWFATIKLINIALNLLVNFFFLWYIPRCLAHDAAHWTSAFYDPAIGIGYIFIANLVASAVTFLLLLLPQIQDWITSNKIQTKDTPPALSLLKPMLMYSSPLVFAGLAGIVNEMLDRTLMKYYLVGPQEVVDAQIGIYGGCYKIAMLISLFTQAYRYAAEPFFFSQGSDKNAPSTFAQTTKWFGIFSAGGALFILLFLDQLKFLTAGAYWEGLRIIPIILLANWLLGLYYNLSIWYKLTDNTSKGAIIAIIGAFVTIVLNVLLLPRIGYMGAAWATLACYAIMTLISYVWSLRYFPVPYAWGKILYPVVVAGLVFGASQTLTLSMSPWMSIPVNLGLGMVWLAAVAQMEWATVKKLVHRK